MRASMRRRMGGGGYGVRKWAGREEGIQGAVYGSEGGGGENMYEGQRRRCMRSGSWTKRQVEARRMGMKGRRDRRMCRA